MPLILEDPRAVLGLIGLMPVSERDYNHPLPFEQSGAKLSIFDKDLV